MAIALSGYSPTLGGDGDLPLMDTMSPLVATWTTRLCLSSSSHATMFTTTAVELSGCTRNKTMTMPLVSTDLPLVATTLPSVATDPPLVATDLPLVATKS